MLGLLEIDCGFCAACCTKLSCCSGLIDAWSEVIFFAGTSATDLVRRLCDVRRHFKAATQSLHTRRGPVRLSIASGRRPREQGRRSLRAYSKEEGPTGIFPYVVREGTRQRKDVRYVGKYRSGTWRVAPNLAIKGRGPVPRK
jgi:hypothetical protein